MEKPLVSVSVLTYQHAKYIRDCLDGILMQQTDFSIEILIHDDASTDGTEEIIREYEQKYPHIIKPLYEQENQWQKGRRGSAVFNFPRAKGKYIALCEGDDYWTNPLKLQKQVDLLEKYSDIGIVHTKYTIKNEITNTLTVHGKNIYDSSLDPFQNYLITGDMRTLTVMFRSKFLKYIEKLYRTEMMARSPLGDRPMFLTISSNSQIGYIDEITGVYRKYEGESATRFKSIQKKYELSKKVKELNLFLMSYLDIDNNTYKNKCKRQLLKAKIFLFLFKIPFFSNIYDFLYNRIGMGGYKNSGYY